MPVRLSSCSPRILLAGIHLQCGSPGFDPWAGKMPWRRERLPTPVFWPGESHGLYIVHGVAESDKTACLSLSLSPFSLPFTSLLFSAICTASSYNHFAFLHFFFLGMFLITTSSAMLQTSIHSSSGTPSIRFNPLNLFVTSTV